MIISALEAEVAQRLDDEHRIGAFVERGATGAVFNAGRLHRVLRPTVGVAGPHEPEVYDERPTNGHVATYAIDPSTGCITALLPATTPGAPS